MTLPKTISDLKPVQGNYCLIKREQVEELYQKAGFDLDRDEEIPNFITLDGKECFFTENFIEKDGEEYEIVMIANGFSFEDTLVYDEE